MMLPTRAEMLMHFYKTVVGEDNPFISSEERQAIIAKQKELDLTIEEMSYEDWNYILSAIKDVGTRSANISVLKSMFFR
jgi:hypothetical protein